jgi:hypothetical protein
MPKRSVNLNKYFDSKDYNYWLFILVLLIVALSTSQFGNNASILNYVSFAGTITSIILAVIAIIYSFFQNFSNTSLNQKLIESADKIENTISNIDNASKGICETSSLIDNATVKIESSSEKIEKVVDTVNDSLKAFSKVSEELTTRFECFSKDLQCAVDTQMEIAQSKITQVYDIVSSQTNVSAIRGKASDKKDIKLNASIVEEYINTSSVVGIAALYFGHLMFKSKIEVDLYKTLTEEFQEFGAYMHGFMVASSCIGLFDLNVTNEEEGLSSIESFSNSLWNKINKRINELSEEHQRETINEYKNSMDKLINQLINDNKAK